MESVPYDEQNFKNAVLCLLTSKAVTASLLLLRARSEPLSPEIASGEASGGKGETGKIRLVSMAVCCWITGRFHQTGWDGVA
jgi:hypothetical protein